jgi:hypothetical protein
VSLLYNLPLLSPTHINKSKFHTFLREKGKKNLKNGFFRILFISCGSAKHCYAEWNEGMKERTVNGSKQ